MKTKTTKLTGEQIDRVGVLVNLAEEDYKHLANKVNDMMYEESLVNTLLYHSAVLKRDEAEVLFKMLQYIFQVGFIEDYTEFDSEIVNYIVLGY